MTQEEKAKRYDEALIKAKNIVNSINVGLIGKDSFEAVFPELKENEDERIRKELLEHCINRRDGKQVCVDASDYRRWADWLFRIGKENIPNVKNDEVIRNEIIKFLELPHPQFVGKRHQEEWIAWLEKQGEKKPTDKVELKFKDGDWVVYDHRTYQVVELPKEGYINLGLRGNGKIEFAPSTYCRHWTIQDAKDGDVLACNEEILLFKSYSVQGRISLYCWYNGQTNNFHSKEVDDASLTTRNKICPATKEQRDLLFQKMKEAGYEWDAEKKELKKIKQKPAWSEEDEKLLDNTIRFIENCVAATSPSLRTYNPILTGKEIPFLKSLKERYTWKPSEEMLEALYRVIPENVMEKSEDEILLDKLYQGLKYGRILSK